ncbi:AAA family ATPase [Leptospira sp. GIMC2001]|uniref:AAA family ATPase n=1 Tax=Leptospira sp. GIMC2001 TaxID=1513297 RepID=UPI002348F330|nr:AAA family ATPase [Leptospira sp. GIMC2001]WCL50738.1 AAA family ATPase [Leptospira sp. GIMC2001]
MGMYIANQVCYEGLDELQRLILAYQLGCHSAIDGPPGVGKTRVIQEVAKILKKNLYSKNCSSRTSESHIISLPMLSVKDGASVTSYSSGPLIRALAEPGIFYGDEFNLLKEDVQKRLNSAFDDRRSIERQDGFVVQGKPGFWAVISYNPSQDMISKDLEESVADRFIHFTFDRWNPDFKAYIAYLSSGKQNDVAIQNLFGIKLSERGIDDRGNFYIKKIVNTSASWVDFWTGNPSSATPEYTYWVNDHKSIYRGFEQIKIKTYLENLKGKAYPEVEFSRVLSRFTETLYQLKKDGKSPVMKQLGLSKLIEGEDLESLSIHETSTRIESSAIRHYVAMREKNFHPYLCQSYATRIVIDQACYGQYRNRQLSKTTTLQLVESLAKSFALMADNSSFNTKIISNKLLKPNSGETSVAS